MDSATAISLLNRAEQIRDFCCFAGVTRTCADSWCARRPGPVQRAPGAGGGSVDAADNNRLLKGRSVTRHQLQPSVPVHVTTPAPARVTGAPGARNGLQFGIPCTFIMLERMSGQAVGALRRKAPP